jgi:hypothetical protein
LVFVEAPRCYRVSFRFVVGLAALPFGYVDFESSAEQFVTPGLLMLAPALQKRFSGGDRLRGPALLDGLGSILGKERPTPIHATGGYRPTAHAFVAELVGSSSSGWKRDAAHHAGGADCDGTRH